MCADRVTVVGRKTGCRSQQTGFGDGRVEIKCCKRSHRLKKKSLEITQKLELIEKQNALSELDKDIDFELEMKTLESENKRIAQQYTGGTNGKR